MCIVKSEKYLHIFLSINFYDIKLYLEKQTETTKLKYQNPDHNRKIKSIFHMKLRKTDGEASFH